MLFFATNNFNAEQFLCILALFACLSVHLPNKLSEVCFEKSLKTLSFGCCWMEVSNTFSRHSKKFLSNIEELILKWGMWWWYNDPWGWSSSISAKDVITNISGVAIHSSDRWFVSVAQHASDSKDLASLQTSESYRGLSTSESFNWRTIDNY